MIDIRPIGTGTRNNDPGNATARPAGPDHVTRIHPLPA